MRLHLENGTVTLNSGYTMPVAGLGSYSLDHDTCVRSVMDLIEALDRGEKHDWY